MQEYIIARMLRCGALKKVPQEFPSEPMDCVLRLMPLPLYEALAEPPETPRNGQIVLALEYPFNRGSFHSRDASRVTCAEMLTAMSTNVAIHRSFACSREVALRVRTRLTSVNLQLAQLLNYRTPIRPHILNELLKPILDQKPLVSFRQPDRRERGPFGRADR
jgi:hypothetical protein